MNFTIVAFFAVYAALGILMLIVWWLIYQAFLARGHDLREAVFGRRPNPAVAMDLLGGFLASAILLYALISLSPRSSFRLNVPAVATNIMALLVLLAVLRLLLAGFLRLWFGGHRDAQGDIISLNNELFVQRNLASGVFSTNAYMILVAGLMQLDLFNQSGNFLHQLWNMLGVWLLGLVLITVHSFFYLEYGTKNHILHECFHDNNPAAPFSQMGLIMGVLPLNHQLLIIFGPGQHMFNSPGLWIMLGMIVLFVLIARGVLQVVLWVTVRINLRHELVIADNVAWGLLDGGLIFALVLIFLALMV